MYRAIDGLAMTNLGTMGTAPIALPRLDLSEDENGFLYIEPPTWTLNENGVIGVGRAISSEEIRQGSELLANSFAKSNPHYPKIPLDFAGYTLSQVTDQDSRVELMYFDFSSTSGYLSITVGLSSSQTMHPDLSNPDFEFWQIGDSIIKIGGSAMEKNNESPDEFKTYEINFFKGGYDFRIEGKNLEFMKKDIVKNYFPEYKFDDMFLISKND
jgi:hypothetical protein